MARYRIELAPAAWRDLRKLPQEVLQRVRTAIDSLAGDALPPGLIKLTGSEDVWRIRVGQYRVLYRLHTQELLIVVVRIGHRREVYR